MLVSMWIGSTIAFVAAIASAQRGWVRCTGLAVGLFIGYALLLMNQSRRADDEQKPAKISAATAQVYTRNSRAIMGVPSLDSPRGATARGGDASSSSSSISSLVPSASSSSSSTSVTLPPKPRPVLRKVRKAAAKWTGMRGLFSRKRVERGTTTGTVQKFKRPANESGDMANTQLAVDGSVDSRDADDLGSLSSFEEVVATDARLTAFNDRRQEEAILG